MTENVNDPLSAKRAFWKGIITCLFLGLIILLFVGYYQFRWYSSRTKASDDELGKIALLLNLQADQTISLEKYEFTYHPFGMDKFGATASRLKRTDKSPTWQEMLGDWNELQGMPDDFAHVKILESAADRLDQQAPFYYRWINTITVSREDDSRAIRVQSLPQLCAAFFDREDPEILYVCTEGDLMWPQVTIQPGETTGTVDWSLPPWHPI